MYVRVSVFPLSMDGGWQVSCLGGSNAEEGSVQSSLPTSYSLIFIYFDRLIPHTCSPPPTQAGWSLMPLFCVWLGLNSSFYNASCTTPTRDTFVSREKKDGKFLQVLHSLSLFLSLSFTRSLSGWIESAVSPQYVSGQQLPSEQFLGHIIVGVKEDASRGSVCKSSIPSHPKRCALLSEP